MLATSPQFRSVLDGNEVVLEHRVSLRLPLTRTNLCLGSSFARGASYWSPIAAGTAPAIAASSTWAARPGGMSGKITWAAAAAGSAGVAQIIGLKLGSSYTFSATVYVPAGAPALGLAVGATIVPVATASTVTGTAQRLSMTFTATATYMLLMVLNAGAATAGQVGYFDQVMLEEDGQPYAAPFDGDDADAEWDGTPGVSTSTLWVGPYPDATLSVESWSVDRQMVTDMPAGTRLLAGYTAATGQLVLSGYLDPLDASKTAAWLFDPCSTDSPLYRVDPTGMQVGIELGVYTTPGSAAEMLPAFLGEADEVLVDHVAGTVALTLIDRRNELRNTASTPSPSIGFESNKYLTAEFVVDALLRSGTKGKVSTWPEPRGRCVLAVGLRGSPAAEIGFVSTAFVDPLTIPAFMPGVNGTAYCGIESGTGTMVWALGDGFTAFGPDLFTEYTVTLVKGYWSQIPQVELIDGSGNGLIITLASASDPNGYAEGVTLRWMKADGTDIGSWTAATAMSAGPHRIAVRVHAPTGTTSWNATVWVDGVRFDSGNQATSYSGRTYGFTYAGCGQLYGVAFVGYGTVEALQVTTETDPVPAGPYTPNAIIDPSSNSLNFIPDIQGKDPWQAIQELASAEGAVATWDEDGLMFRWRNRASVTSYTSVQTVRATGSLESVQSHSMKSAIATRVQQPVNALAEQTETVVWHSSSKYRIGARSRLTITARLDTPCVHVRVSVPLYSDYIAGLSGTDIGVIPPTGISTDPTVFPRSGYRACTRSDGNGDAVENLQMTAVQTSSTTVVITIYNPNNSVVYMVTASRNGYGFAQSNKGEPYILLSGTPLVGQGKTLADSQWPAAPDGGAVSNRKYGEIVLAMPQNDWVQDFASAQARTDDLLGDLYQWKPMWENVSVVPDPSRQLCDRITLESDDGITVAADALITGIHTTGGRASFTQSLTLRSIAPPGAWLMGVPGASEMGETTYA